VPKQAVIARDSQALSPSRSTLAQLLYRRAQLAAEAEPWNQKLARIDAATAEHARAAGRVAALSAEHQSKFAEAITDGDPPPPKSHELIRAEAEALEAEEGRAAAAQARELMAGKTQAINEQLAVLGREIEGQIAQVIAEAALDFAKTHFRQAYQVYATAFLLPPPQPPGGWACVYLPGPAAGRPFW
jgi:hypothetical protein